MINFKKLNQYIPYERFKTEGLFLLKKFSRRTIICAKFEGRLLCSSPSFKLPEIYQVQMEMESLSVSTSLLLPKFSSKGILKRYSEDPNFNHVEIECEIGNISRLYFDNDISKKWN